ncbi:Membrane protein involved in the export of O-antigen and teichoic acid [Paracoccus tibetensis]|uniref:Membrane protein involved in the export of O-antigen and teichoic acid n=2 Tax=Paracoccus tibetensis TaxID=336292 RepID=A0A1G5GQ84_9RHOB|nr:Membrane protein involved in the export of O-antigen and teichoic acid [Paracoccus tibetensis]
MIRARIGMLMSGDSLLPRAFRSSILTLVSFGGQQGIRLASNLILTRLLFPEVFGLMAIIMVVIIGLTTFSDVGIGPAILQSKRGDDQKFLDTAYTMQAVRGVVLWICCCIMAVPAARFYEVPELVWYLPVAGLTTIIYGLLPTTVESANRHLKMGRLTLVELLSVFIGTSVTIILAALMGSAWALVIGLLLGAIIKVILVLRLLPGPRNRFTWDRSAAQELISFGKWIVPSTVVGFALSQGDKAVLGRYLTLTELGIYNIAFFLASFPQMLATAIISRLMIPVYRDLNEDPSPHRKRRMRVMRAGMTAMVMLMLAAVATWAVPLVEFLYDDRYRDAGGLVTLVALTSIPPVIVMTYDQGALAVGDSRGFFWLTFVRAVLFMACFVTGAHYGGIPGALLGQAVAAILAYPMLVRLARRSGVWDGWHDLTFAILGLILAWLLLG